ncbi:MAG TPA: hypothetical protein PLS90_04275 [Candidatus Sumerlaeota bacterium]|nr:hypothetical protein [Candidatus Sumerlaeota bacterium]HOR27443.1 hypothetical protein [Candidatus Sumerlaeota bacterium]HPK01653.1 hypothetical protein [Candidatus Sumerlaeota bacterium]
MEFRVRPDRERGSGMEILRLAGIPFYAEFSFFIFAALLVFLFLTWDWTIQQAGLQVIIVLISLIAHEGGHAVMARLMGCRQVSVSLIMFGGQTYHEPTTNGRNLLIVLAGPALTLVLMLFGFGLLFVPAVHASDAGRFVCGSIGIMNLIWFIFNMLPIFPMDGGMTILYTLAFFMREHRAMFFVSLVSMAACILAGLALYLSGLQVTMAYIFLILFFLQNMAVYKTYR